MFFFGSSFCDNKRYYSELKEILCAENAAAIDWEDIETSFAKPKACKDYLSKVGVG